MKEILHRKREIKWLTEWKEFFLLPWVGILAGGSLAILSLCFAFLYVNFYEVSGDIVLHFDIYKGIDAFGSLSRLYYNLGLALFIAAIDIFLAKAVMEKSRFMAYLLLFTSAYFSTLIFIGILAIIKVN